MAERTESLWEKHIASRIAAFFAAMAFGVASYIAFSVQDSQIQLASLRESILAIKEDVQELKIASAHGYSRHDAIKDFKLRDQRINEMERRIKKLEEKRE